MKSCYLKRLDVIFQQGNAPAHNRKDNQEAAWEQVH